MERAHIIVVGNAKGGSGKSTTAMHVAIRLLTRGQRVAVVDLDGRQQTLTRYMENREAFNDGRAQKLPMPTFAVVEDSEENNRAQAHKSAYARLCDILSEFVPQHDVVVMDCPGSDTFLARVGHGFADTLLTPLNDSFIDLDVLARVDAQSYRLIKPSWYSEMVWAQRKKRFLQDGHRIDWAVMRNRLMHTQARNKRNVQQALEALARPCGFRQIGGLSDRVIFRELFLKGLTLSDVQAYKTGVELTMNHVAAHQEIRDLVHAIALPEKVLRAAAS